ncbi:MAG: hypothetical protein SVY10_01610 [Thermodesulfobacteriota bacterium]|nr:hypothetical protein [Thermodesulfobacteriota bacterium]
MIRNTAPEITGVLTTCGTMVPLDLDVSPFDDSKTIKESVSRTYKGYDGYGLIFAYLGREDYLVNLELRQGKQHCQHGTVESGHFQTNALVLLLGMLSYNILRLCGHESLRDDNGNSECNPTYRRNAGRRRIRTVMQDLIYVASRLIFRSRQWFLSLGKYCACADFFHFVTRTFNILL